MSKSPFVHVYRKAERLSRGSSAPGSGADGIAVDHQQRPENA